ncbi:cupin domain-containing protein [Roseomonas harenae]|nr:cupin domain-containing protein [Roseomonas harenae]
MSRTSSLVFRQSAHDGQRDEMKILVIGGTGLIGSEPVSRLREWGHEAVPASPALGVNTMTGEGLSQATLVYEHIFPNVPVKSIKAVLVEYGPGGLSPAHTHPAPAFIYATVLEGAIRSQVSDRPATVHRADESLSEVPGDRHAVSENVTTRNPRACWPCSSSTRRRPN